MKKNKKQDLLNDLIENNDDDILILPHSYINKNKDITLKSVIPYFLIVFITVIALRLIFLSIFPNDLVMKIGNIKVTKEQYDYIYEHYFLPNLNESYNSVEMDVDKIDETLKNRPYYSRSNIDFIKENILLGLKAKELGYSVSDSYLVEKEKFGDLAEYFILANNLKNNVNNSDTYLNSTEKKSIYNSNKDLYIDYTKSTITYKAYFTDENFKKINNDEVTINTETFTEFSFKNYVENVPLQDSYLSLPNGQMIYYEILETNIIYKDYQDVKDEIQNTYTEFKTNDILVVYMNEMANKHKVKTYM